MTEKCKVEFSMEMPNGMKTEIKKEMSMAEAKKIMLYVKEAMKDDNYMKGGMNG